jgi:hypothetical protein
MATGDGRSERRALRILCLAVGLLLFIYSVVRAAHMSFTHDESHTWVTTAWMPFDQLLVDHGTFQAQNYLNVVAMSAITHSFSSSEWALRLPALLGHLLYLLATYSIVRRFRSPSLAAASFVLLNVNPFLLDFFSLARGYGLATGLSTLAVAVGTLPARGAWRIGRNLAAASLGGIAVLTNLSLLIFYLALIIMLVVGDLAQVWPGREEPRPTLPTLLLGTAALAAHAALVCQWAVPRGEQLRRSGELYYGGQTGFWADTVMSLIGRSLYNHEWPLALWVMQALVVLVPLGSLAVIVHALWRRRLDAPVMLVATSTGVLLACVTATLIEHELWGLRFLLDRTALFMIPLFWISAVGTLDCLWELGGRRHLERAAVALAMGALLVGALTLNLRGTIMWDYDADTKDMVMALAAAQRVPKDGRLQLGVSPLLEPTVNYYRALMAFHWLVPVDRQGLSHPYDYFLYIPADASKMQGRCTQIVRQTKLATLARSCTSPY